MLMNADEWFIVEGGPGQKAKGKEQNRLFGCVSP
jgi:hypothetical protein